MHPEERDELNRRASAAGLTLQLYLRSRLGLAPKANRDEARMQIHNSREGQHSASETQANQSQTTPCENCQGQCPAGQVPCV
ncbi:MAG: hypothetical protein Aurels2KO_25410 [Aureliella sp.]